MASPSTINQLRNLNLTQSGRFDLDIGVGRCCLDHDKDSPESQWSTEVPLGSYSHLFFVIDEAKQYLEDLQGRGPFEERKEWDGWRVSFNPTEGIINRSKELSIEVRWRKEPEGGQATEIPEPRKMIIRSAKISALSGDVRVEELKKELNAAQFNVSKDEIELVWAAKEKPQL